MSFFEDASLVLIPSAIKDQKVYSVKPTDGSGDLTFSRASDATRVASNGLIEKVRTNVALYSEDQTNWTDQNETSVTANAAANPLNGAVTADKVIPSTATDDHYRGLSMGSIVGEFTSSIYVKADGYSIIDYGVFNSTASNYPVRAVFDLSTQTITQINGSISSITSVGSGWYRISVSASVASTSTMGIYHRVRSTGTSGTYAGDGTSGMLLWGCQLESGVMTPYIGPTTTAAVSVGPVSGLPRLDYLNSSCPRLLLEPQRTNILPQSNYFGAADWVKINGSIATNQATSPEGIGNASTFTEDTSSGFHVVYDNIVAAFSTAHTLSAFVKPNGRNIMYLRMENASTGSGLGITYFNISTGQILTDSSTSSSIEAYANGWYRVSITATTPAAQSTLFAIGLADADNSRSYTGDGTSGIYLYGAQAEPSATYPTSLIPTYGTSVTRVADAASKTGISSLIGQTEGTIYWEGKVDGFAPINESLPISLFATGATTSGAQIYVTFLANGRISYVVYDGANVQAQVQTTTSFYTLGTNIKIAAVYKANDFTLYINGVQIGTDTSGSVVAASELYLDYKNNVGNYSTSQVLLFKTRLTNAQLAELTA